MAPRLRIAICGGGIGGLITAVSLSKYEDLEVNIYEAARELAEAGAGIGLWPRHWQILEKFGVDVDLNRHAEPPTSRNFNQRISYLGAGATFVQFPPQGKCRGFHRASFQMDLLRHVSPSHQILCSKRLESYSQDPLTKEITIFFEDGTSDVCDLLIGADGVRSAVRRNLVSKEAEKARAAGLDAEAEAFLRCAEPCWSGMVVYRTLTPAENLKKTAPTHRVFEGPTQYLGDGTIVNVYPVAGGKGISVGISYVRKELEGTVYPGGKFIQYGYCPEDLHGDLASWEPEAQALLATFEDKQDIAAWASHYVLPLPSFISGSVVLLGDAAHAMNPHLGVGAGLAIEDAAVLAEILGCPRVNIDNVQAALTFYNDIRRPQAFKASADSMLMMQLLSLTAPGHEASGILDDDNIEKLGQKILDTWSWVWETTTDADIEDVRTRLSQQL
ncbi:FAD/NAD(P)-binding domain-containing protein [Flagelloscypha sp. PMI_526]|nr:FAD/NAD(P)-binding domain-containing protein [Flagelloscypha sp. PMI_526]